MHRSKTSSFILPPRSPCVSILAYNSYFKGLKLEAGDNLAAPGLGARAVEPVHVAVAGGQQAAHAAIGVVAGSRRGGICGADRRQRVEQPVEDVIEFRP